MVYLPQLTFAARARLFRNLFTAAKASLLSLNVQDSVYDRYEARLNSYIRISLAYLLLESHAPVRHSTGLSSCELKINAGA